MVAFSYEEYMKRNRVDQERLNKVFEDTVNHHTVESDSGVVTNKIPSNGTPRHSGYYPWSYNDHDQIVSATTIMRTRIKKVIFNDPATIVFWSDGTKTVVKTGDGDIFDPYNGLCIAIAKKIFGNNSRLKSFVHKYYGGEVK